MKAGFIGAALGLAAVAAAQPHHHARHEQFHRRDVQTETVTNTVTDTLEEVVVYMDESGKPVSTSTFYKKMTPSTQAAPAPAATSAPSSSSAVAANFLAATHAAESSSSAAPAPAASSSSSSSASSSSSSSGSLSGSHSGSKGGIGFGSGVSYSPYHDSGACKDVSAIKQDLAKLDMDVIRLYGTDCKQVENTLDALKEMGKSSQLFVGIFDIGSWSSEADTIISAVKNHAGGDWSKINAVNVGNEIVNAGGSVSQVTSAVSSTRSKLQSAGYNGPVVTVDTMVAHRDHPELAEASDFVAMNCHAFFDGNVDASGAGEFVQGWVKQIGDAHPGKKVIVTESGWPSQGDTNQKCVPSEANQSAAVGSLKSSFSENLILFSAYNNKWKTSSAAQFNAEQWWGIMGNSPSSN